MTIRIRGHVQTSTELLDALNSLSLRAAPGFLGDFDYQQYKVQPGVRTALPEVIRDEFIKLEKLVPVQIFNTWFIQKYNPGQGVLPHRDPKNNVGYTILGLYGRDWETRLEVKEEKYVDDPWGRKHLDLVKYKQFPGDVFILPCTIHGIQGSTHQMTWPQVPDFDTQGTRWALICSTIL